MIRRFSCFHRSWMVLNIHRTLPSSISICQTKAMTWMDMAGDGRLCVCLFSFGLWGDDVGGWFNGGDGHFYMGTCLKTTKHQWITPHVTFASCPVDASVPYRIHRTGSIYLQIYHEKSTIDSPFKTGRGPPCKVLKSSLNIQIVSSVLLWRVQ